jgi:hypothetical protein
LRKEMHIIVNTEPPWSLSFCSCLISMAIFYCTCYQTTPVNLRKSILNNRKIMNWDLSLEMSCVWDILVVLHTLHGNLWGMWYVYYKHVIGIYTLTSGWSFLCWHHAKYFLYRLNSLHKRR